MRIEVNAKVILTAQGYAGAAIDPTLSPEDIVLAAEQMLNNLQLHNIPADASVLQAKAQYGIRVHMNEITQIIE